jgi:hypothetical protein
LQTTFADTTIAKMKMAYMVEGAIGFDRCARLTFISLRHNPR